MRKENMHRALALTAFATFAFAAGNAGAHVTISPTSAAAGSYFFSAFTVPHGCDGSPTVALRVKVPEGLSAVKPKVKPGWTIAIKTRKLDKPIKGERGQIITEGVDEIDWQGGPLPDNEYDTFGLMMKLPDTAGRTLYFPVVQECRQGVHRWIEIPAAGQSRDELREPAPALKIVPKAP